jgi:hypothetical protein
MNVGDEIAVRETTPRFDVRERGGGRFWPFVAHPEF